ncbi:trehalase-like domain-containing protein [Streptomyces sp. NPDC059787]|uniref:trehalase-like domain-containing protein n=1 Tax=Streptomyces sp. NPDC059787 TaxID=3346947 RepID=UPI003666DA02
MNDASEDGGRAGEGPWALRDYALIADGERGALVDPRGSIVWMCAPAWHDGAVFAALLGGPGPYRVSPGDPWNVRARLARRRRVRRAPRRHLPGVPRRPLERVGRLLRGRHPHPGQPLDRGGRRRLLPRGPRRPRRHGTPGAAAAGPPYGTSCLGRARVPPAGAADTVTGGRG